MCDLFAMLQQRYEDFSSEILILSFCVYVFTLCLFSLCLFSYSGLMFVFGFDMLSVLPVLLFALREAFKLEPVKREAALLVHIRPYFIDFIFRSQATFILGESSETILLFVDSGGSEVGHVPLDVRNG